MLIKTLFFALGTLISGTTTTTPTKVFTLQPSPTTTVIKGIFSNKGTFFNRETISNDTIGIDTGYFENYGTIQALSKVELDLASLSNKGSILAPEVAIKCIKNCENEGSITCTNTCHISAHNLSSRTGTIGAPCITLQCNQFDFKGTIICDQQCTIYAKEPFDLQMFKIKGKGSVTALISPYAVEKHTIESLITKIKKQLIDELLETTSYERQSTLKEVLHYVETNNLQQKTVAAAIDTLLTAQIAYHQERLDVITDTKEFYKGLKGSGIPALAVGLTTFSFLYREKIQKILIDKCGLHQDSSAVVTWMTLLSEATFAQLVIQFSPMRPVAHFKAWLNPQHKEKIQHLEKIKALFHDAFSAPYVSQQQVINIR